MTCSALSTIPTIGFTQNTTMILWYFLEMVEEVRALMVSWLASLVEAVQVSKYAKLPATNSFAARSAVCVQEKT